MGKKYEKKERCVLSESNIQAVLWRITVNFLHSECGRYITAELIRHHGFSAILTARRQTETKAD
jgi:hypothetical protein